jgi:hypothetical protein
MCDGGNEYVALKTGMDYSHSVTNMASMVPLIISPMMIMPVSLLSVLIKTYWYKLV